MPNRLLTVAEYLELGEIDCGYTELQEGRVLLSPNQSVRHAVATRELMSMLDGMAEGSILRAADVLVAVEIVSPGSKRTDNVIKRGEYADAGIPHYWIVDLDEPVSLVDCQLAEGFGYRDAGGVTGVFETESPFPGPRRSRPPVLTRVLRSAWGERSIRLGKIAALWRRALTAWRLVTNLRGIR